MKFRLFLGVANTSNFNKSEFSNPRKIRDFRLIFRLIPKFSDNFHVKIEEKHPDYFARVEIAGFSKI